MITKFGYRNIAVITPLLHLGNPKANALEMIKCAKESAEKEALVSLFPELSLTGYSCEDLFHGGDLYSTMEEAILEVVKESKKIKTVMVFGLPFAVDGRLYNCAMVINQGKILGVVPKTHLPNYKEFYEQRFFTSGRTLNTKVKILGQEVLVSTDQIFSVNGMKFGIEICEDLWSPIPPSSKLALAGAGVILNLSASNELVGKNQYRKDLISQQSARLNCVYAYVSSGPKESTKDVVFSGAGLICENGSILAESPRYVLDQSVITVSTIDLDKINSERRKNTTYGNEPSEKMTVVDSEIKGYVVTKLARKYEPKPFVPGNLGEGLNDRLEEILNIQSVGLARRMMSVKTNQLVLGLSGGLDSTLAALVAIRALEKLNLDAKNLLAISMPGFGTSSRTKQQSKDLAEQIGVTFQEIDISLVTKQHLKDIDHENILDNTYENAQARERTQILFDLANKHKGIVVGTGNLSELALGWATFNGDHMSNYGVNGSIPKTLVRHLVQYVANNSSEEKRQVLERVLNTVVSPELLPTNAKGEIEQSTEDILGPYELHDFFLFHYLRNGFPKDKIHFIAKEVFKGKYEEEKIEKTLNTFYKRFYQNQFKRTTLPPGPKVGSVSLSPRGDWRAPDEGVE